MKERRKKLLSGHSYSFFNVLPKLKKKRSEHRVRHTIPGLRSLPDFSLKVEQPCGKINLVVSGTGSDLLGFWKFLRTEFQL